MKYITPKEAAEKWGISQRRVHLLCGQGRIEGAERHGGIWLIPAEAEKPKDARIKTGIYIKSGRQSLTAAAEAADSMPQPETKGIPSFIPVPPDHGSSVRACLTKSPHREQSLPTYTPMRATAKPPCCSSILMGAATYSGSHWRKKTVMFSPSSGTWKRLPGRS
ncbi:MAG: hypothetical protein HPY66_3016 [Firmicutes bacterium]|nr:hypothetical protein [Bacillota bacterium]